MSVASDDLVARIVLQCENDLSAGLDSAAAQTRAFTAEETELFDAMSVAIAEAVDQAIASLAALQVTMDELGVDAELLRGFGGAALSTSGDVDSLTVAVEGMQGAADTFVVSVEEMRAAMDSLMVKSAETRGVMSMDGRAMGRNQHGRIAEI